MTFSDERPNGSDFSAALAAIDFALVSGAWIDAALGGEDSSVYRTLSADPSSGKAYGRFFPGFGEDPPSAALQFIREMDPTDPLDVGVLAALTVWLRTSLSRDREAFGRFLGGASLEQVRQESPIVLVLAIPFVVKAAGGTATVGAAVTGVLKGVEKYFTIQNTRADTADKKAGEALKHAQTRKTNLESEEIARRLEIAGGPSALAEPVASGLAAALPDASVEALGPANELGGRIAAATAVELDQNPSVASVGSRP